MVLLMHGLVNWQLGPVFAWYLIGAWVALVGTLFVYPLIGLALEHAPPRAYLPNWPARCSSFGAPGWR
jgi:hypothetical protein